MWLFEACERVRMILKGLTSGYIMSLGHEIKDIDKANNNNNNNNNNNDNDSDNNNNNNKWTGPLKQQYNMTTSNKWHKQLNQAS